MNDDFGSFGDFVNNMDMSGMDGGDGLRDRYRMKLTRAAIRESFLSEALSDGDREQIEGVGEQLDSAVSAMLTPFTVGEDDPAGWMVDDIKDRDSFAKMMFLLMQAQFIQRTKSAVDLLIPLRNVLVVSGNGYFSVSDNVVDEMLDILDMAEGDMLPYMAVALMNVVRQFGPDEAKPLLANVHPDLSNLLYRFINAFIGLYGEFRSVNNEVRERLFGVGFTMPGLDSEDDSG